MDPKLQSQLQNAIRPLAMAGKLDEIKALFSSDPYNRNIEFCKSYCLRVAAKFGQIDVVRYLLENGAVADKPVLPDSGPSAIDFAQMRKDEPVYNEILELLKKHTSESLRQEVLDKPKATPTELKTSELLSKHTSESLRQAVLVKLKFTPTELKPIENPTHMGGLTWLHPVRRHSHFERQRAIDNNIWGSIHRSAGESAIRLSQRYSNEIIPVNISKHLHAIEVWLKSLPYKDSKDKNILLLFNHIKCELGDYKEPTSSISVRQLLALTWAAIHDDKVRLGSLDDALSQLFDAFNEVARDRSLDRGGSLGFVVESICGSSAFNKFIEILVGRHPDAQIVVITTTNAAAKLPCIIQEELALYLEQIKQTVNIEDLRRHVADIKKHGLALVWEQIGQKITDRVFEEFGRAWGGNRQNQHFVAFMKSCLSLVVTEIELSTEPAEVSARLTLSS